GLDRGQIVPIRGGGRLTGRVGRYTLGLLNIQTGADDAKTVPSTNFSVLRLRRDLLRGSSVGALFTGRTASPGTTAGNAAYGLDGIFSFFTNLNINTYWARTEDAGRKGPPRIEQGSSQASDTRYCAQ